MVKFKSLNEKQAAAIHPKILLKVILLAYARGMISSRQIERACQENIIFWLDRIPESNSREFIIKLSDQMKGMVLHLVGRVLEESLDTELDRFLERGLSDVCMEIVVEFHFGDFIEYEYDCDWLRKSRIRPGLPFIQKWV